MATPMKAVIVNAHPNGRILSLYTINANNAVVIGVNAKIMLDVAAGIVRNPSLKTTWYRKFPVIPNSIYSPHSRQVVGMCNPLATPMMSINIAPIKTLATDNDNGSIYSSATLLNGNAVAHTAMVAKAPIIIFALFDIISRPLPIYIILQHN